MRWGLAGLISSAWALANAEARAATDSLDWCMGGLRRKDVEAYGARFRPLGPSSLFARSWSRKASRVLRKSAANSAQEFDALISTMRIASMRGRGGSALMRWGVSPDCTQRQNFFSADTRTLR